MQHGAVLLGLLLVGCGPAARAPEPMVRPAPPAVASETPREEQEESLSGLAGRYRLDEASAPSGCGGQVVLAAKHLRIDAKSRTAHADVVNRVYSARASEGGLIAEGRFSVSGGCAGSFIFERWTLTRDGMGRLSGELESLWTLPPDCEKPCLVRIPIVATPITGE